MKEKFNSISPYYQALLLFVLGVLVYFLLSMIMSVIISHFYPGMVVLSIEEQTKQFPIPFMLVYYIPVQIGFILFPGLLYLFLDKKKIPYVFKKPSLKFAIWGFLLFGTVFFLLPFFAEVNIYLLKILGEFEELFTLKEQSDQQLVNIIGEKNSLTFYLSLIIIGVLPGIAEELTFRRFLFHHLFKNSNRLVGSIFASALVFALLHFNYVQIVPLFIFGIVLALMYYASGSILPGVIAHALNNCINVYWIATDSFPDWMEKIDLKITIPSTLLLMGLLIYFARKK